MKALVINSYAGSILLGATHLGMDVIGSYEDHAFGMDIQKANVPGIHYIPHIKDWPTQNLMDTIVVAHPPCSAFSVQNCSPTARGSESEAFACTKKVLQYACDNNALGIAIESVMGALPGAWNQHQHYADTYGYHLYRILENGCMFGCQWRERFWVLYIKKGAARPTLQLTLQPHFQTVRQVITGHEDGRSAGNLDVLLERQKKRLLDDAKLSPEEMAYLFDAQDPPHPTKALGTVLYEYKYKTPETDSFDKWNVFQDYIGGFASGTMVYLDPNGTTPVLMGGSHWYYNGRNVSENAFKVVMGFPADYIFPESPRNYRTQMRMYLSKGVMPPIAEWILEQATLHLGWTGQARRHDEFPGSKYQLECEPNQIADFRIKKVDWWERDTVLPPLRDDEAVKNKLKTVRPVCEHVFADDAKCIKCGWLPKAPKMPKIRVERAPRVVRERDLTPRRGRLSDIPLVGTDIVVTGQTITDRKRALIHSIVLERQVMTHEEAITACLLHPELQILPTTMHWHIRQMVKAGHLKEVGHEVVAWYAARAAGQMDLGGVYNTYVTPTEAAAYDSSSIIVTDAALQAAERVINNVYPQENEMRHFHDVGRFHEKFDLDNTTHRSIGPREVSKELLAFRLNFLAEELRETANAMGFNCRTELEYVGHEVDIVGVADGLIDLEYVNLGTAHVLGLPWGELFDEVHSANMKKERAVREDQSLRNSTFDVVKPEGWTKPDVAGVLRYYGWKV